MATMTQAQVRLNKHTIYQQKEWWRQKYDGRKKMFRGVDRDEFAKAKKTHKAREWQRICAKRDNLHELRRAYEVVKSRAGAENGNYQKIPMYGHTHLYLCHPYYGHADYNKGILLTIKGHEAACEWLIKIGRKIAGMEA